MAETFVFDTSAFIALDEREPGAAEVEAILSRAWLGEVEVHASFATLTELEFLNQGSPGKLMLKLRWLFARTRLAQEEVNILRGILTAAQAAKRLAGKSRD